MAKGNGSKRKAGSSSKAPKSDELVAESDLEQDEPGGSDSAEAKPASKKVKTSVRSTLLSVDSDGLKSQSCRSLKHQLRKLLQMVRTMKMLASSS